MLIIHSIKLHLHQFFVNCKKTCAKNLYFNEIFKVMLKKKMIYSLKVESFTKVTIQICDMLLLGNKRMHYNAIPQESILIIQKYLKLTSTFCFVEMKIRPTQSQRSMNFHISRIYLVMLKSANDNSLRML